MKRNARRGICCLEVAISALLLPGIAYSQQSPTDNPQKAQTPAPGFAMGFRAGPRSPEVLGDNRVTFRLSAPNAMEVVLNGDWPGGSNVRMSKDDQGVWSVTTGPLDPELWGYTFSVDGVRTLDPGNPETKRDGVRYDNILLISGPESALYEVRDVPHGTVAAVWYESPTLKMVRRMYVYTPPGYENGHGRYPVFYLLHGGGGDEEAWCTLGRANWVLDNLIAREKAKPMIVVMPNGNANQKMSTGSGPVPGQSLQMRLPRARSTATPQAGLFPDSLVKDIIPYVEKHYRAIKDRNHRAIAGLSMGGGQTMAVTAEYPAMFGYIGVWSAGSRQSDEEITKQLSSIKAAGMRLYYVGCGVDDPLAHTGSVKLVDLLRKLDMRYRFRESTGGHTWFNWRIYLSQFAPMLFR
jgi:enterochelin esterase-like enzyme